MKGAPVRIGWLADFGVTNGRSLPLLMKEAGAFTDRRLDAIIHVGDIAYDLDCRADELGPGSEHAAVMTGQANGLSTVTSTGIDGFIGLARQPRVQLQPYRLHQSFQRHAGQCCSNPN